MSQVLILNGSGRGKKSTSAALGIYLIDLLKEEDLEATMLTVRNQLNSKERINDMVGSINKATHVIVTVPLYDDCQTYNIVKAQEIIAESKLELENKQFLPIVNSGFGEPEQITEGTIPIYKKFASSVGFKWGGSLSIGGGEMLRGRYGKLVHKAGPFAKNAIIELEKIVESIKSDATYLDTEIILLPKLFYKWPFKQLFTSMNNSGWKKAAEKNGAKVDAQPFL